MTLTTIAFLTSGHSPYDDRIYYHFADTLKQYSPVIISSTIDLEESRNGILIDSFNSEKLSKTDKLETFRKKLEKYKPGVIICSEPLPIIAAKQYKQKNNKKTSIIYDITEWYPSKKNTEGFSYYKKIYKSIILWLFNIYATSFSNAFIFGEYFKKYPYRYIFPLKKWEIIGYYPSLKYIQNTPHKFNKSKICLGYTGRISLEKGIGNFLEVVKSATLALPETEITVKIIGRFVNDMDKKDYVNSLKGINNAITFIDYVEFTDFSKNLEDIDICFDLRAVDYENNRCLPIKIFYYAACGKPVIYSNLKAIRKEFDVSEFGYLVNPKDVIAITNYILEYYKDPNLYTLHSTRALKLAKNNYSWEKIEYKLTNFIKSLTENQN